MSTKDDKMVYQSVFRDDFRRIERNVILGVSLITGLIMTIELLILAILKLIKFI